MTVHMMTKTKALALALIAIVALTGSAARPVASYTRTRTEIAR